MTALSPEYETPLVALQGSRPLWRWPKTTPKHCSKPPRRQPRSPQRAAAVGRRSALAGAARVRGTLCAARDDHHGARRSFDAALAHAHGLPFELARCHHSYGKALAAAGNTTMAHTQLAAARAIFAAGDALAFVNLVDLDLAHAGPLVPAGPEATLTAREQAVARLAAQGLTNPEIADKLTVSRKTVEYHLSNVYAKLGIRSRTQLTQLLEHAPGMRPD
jgi:DNA-binding CsgD family transcriptional regulator